MTMSELPYGPEELKESSLDGKGFLKFLQEEKRRKYPEPPPLYPGAVATNRHPVPSNKSSKETSSRWAADFRSSR